MLCFSQPNNIDWDYPIKPGTEEWTNFKSGQEMLNACQIPENILKNLSTSPFSLFVFKLSSTRRHAFF